LACLPLRNELWMHLSIIYKFIRYEFFNLRELCMKDNYILGIQKQWILNYQF
jgi:hypothetical protein